MIDFEGEGKDSSEGGRLPQAFMPTFHQYYHTRIRDIEDDLPKFGAEKGEEPLNKAGEEMAQEEAERKDSKKANEDLRERKPEGEDDKRKLQGQANERDSKVCPYRKYAGAGS